MDPLLNTTRRKFFAFIGLILLVLVFNWGDGRAIKLEQIRFEDWLRNNQLLLTKEGNYTAPAQEIILQLSANLPDQPDLQLQISTGQAPDKVQRLLNLAKEAKLFKGPAVRDPQAMQLRIQQGATQFAASIDQELLDENLQTRTLVKLFEIYAKQNQS